jgi:hypothetical protein
VFHLVNATSVILFCLCMGFIYSILCHVLYAEGYFYLCVLKEFSNSSYLFATLCKGGIFCFSLLRSVCVFCFVGEGVF